MPPRTPTPTTTTTTTTTTTAAARVPAPRVVLPLRGATVVDARGRLQVGVATVTDPYDGQWAQRHLPTTDLHPQPHADDQTPLCDLLDDLHASLTRHVIFPSPAAADATTLWDAATHAQDAWETAPRLVVKSPVRRCGKSRLLDLLEHTAHNVIITANVSPAALARSVTDHDPPTLLIDEQDAVFAKRHGERSETAEVLRGLINAGHQRGRPYTRWDVTTRALERCPTFAMVAIAAIGDLPDTIEDRGVVVTMRRRSPGEQVTPFRRRRHAPGLWKLRDRLHAAIASRLKELEQAAPDLPVTDRAADTWEPLVAIADLAGGDWPERARQACKVMTAQAEDDADGTAGERLLTDLRIVFGEAQALWTVTIIEQLAKLDEAPWADWYGQRITDRGVAKLLRPYGIRSRDVKLNETVRKGYRREDLHDAWQRYSTPARPSATSATAQVNPVADGSGVADSAPASATPLPSATRLTSEVAEVAEVAARMRESGQVRCSNCGASGQFDPTSDYGRRRLQEGHLDCGTAWEPAP